MTDLEAVNARISRRTFFDKHIEAEKVAKLKGLLCDLNLKSGLMFTYIDEGKEAFSFKKSYGMFSGVRSFVVFKGDKNIPDMKEKVGYYGEIFVLEAVKLGLGACWVGLTFDSSNSLLGADVDEEVVCVLPLGYAPESATLKEKLIRGISHRKTKTIEQMSFCEGTPPEWFSKGMSAVVKAPSAMNSQKTQFRYANGEVSAFVDTSSRFDAVDLGICKLHFEIGAGCGRFAFGNGAKFTPQ